MSIGRIEMVDGKKQYVRYATLGGGSTKPSYDPILANNTWAQIDQASREGKAKELWNLGDEKDGYAIVGFNHDDLSDGSGKAGITFAIKKHTVSGKWASSKPTTIVYYKDSLYPAQLKSMHLTSDGLRNAIKEVKKKCVTGTSASITGIEEIDCGLFLFSAKEIGGNVYGFLSNEGEIYENFPLNAGAAYATRTVNFSAGMCYAVNTYGSVISADVTSTYGVRYGFCI